MRAIVLSAASSGAIRAMFIERRCCEHAEVRWLTARRARCRAPVLATVENSARVRAAILRKLGVEDERGGEEDFSELLQPGTRRSLLNSAPCDTDIEIAAIAF